MYSRDYTSIFDVLEWLMEVEIAEVLKSHGGEITLPADDDDNPTTDGSPVCVYATDIGDYRNSGTFELTKLRLGDADTILYYGRRWDKADAKEVELSVNICCDDNCMIMHYLPQLKGDATRVNNKTASIRRRVKDAIGRVLDEEIPECDHEDVS